jgi:hypothetical protein
LDLQSRVAEEATRCGTALQRIADFQQKAVAGILVPDAPPIWTIKLWSDAVAGCPSIAGKVASTYWTAVAEYFREPRQAAPPCRALHCLSLVFSVARRKIVVWEKSRRGCIVGDLGLRATLRSGVGRTLCFW